MKGGKMNKVFVIALFLVLTLGLVLAIENESGRGNDSSDKNSSEDRNQTSEGIGEDLSEQIAEKKEEIKSGDYNTSLGQLLNVRDLSEDLRELRVNGVRAQTELNITSDTDSEGKTRLKTKLRNGTEAEIKIMPDTASATALERLRLKVCSSDNNCTIQLKDVGNGTNERVQYEVQIERHSKILGIFQSKMQVSVDINAGTGEAKTHKPWWAFLATEPTE